MTGAQAASVDASDLPPLSPDWRYEPVSALGQPDEQVVLTGPFGTNLGRGDFVEQGVPVLTIGCLTEGGINLDKALYVSKEKARELERYQLREGDLLFSRMASVGRAGIVPKSLAGALFNYHIMRLRLDESRIDPRVFINYVRGAKQVRDYLKAVNHGATRDGINTEQLLGLPVAVPPPAVQREMVAEIEKQFSRLDEAVASLKRVNTNLKRYKAAVLKAAVKGRLVPTEAELARREGRSYETGAQLLTRIVDARRRTFSGRGKYAEPESLQVREPLPEGWTWTSLDQLLISLRNGLSRKPEDSPPGIPILRISAVRPLDLDLEDHRYYRLHDGEAVNDHTLCAHDLLFVRYNGTKELVGACALVPEVQGQVLYPDKLIRGRVVADSLVSPSYLALAANVGISRKHIDELIKTTAGQQGISGSELKRMPIPLPPIHEQQRIIAEVDRRLSILREADVQTKHGLARAQTLRGSALSAAFYSHRSAHP